MTLEEAMNISFDPIHTLFTQCIEHLDDEKGKVYLEKLESLGDIDGKTEAMLAALAFKFPPNHDAYDNAIRDLMKNHKGKVNELMEYRRIVPIITRYIEELNLQIYGWKYVAEKLLSECDNNNKRWSAEDDDYLIEMACNDVPETVMSASLKRSPSAIRTRITYLVGVKRLSQQVAGKFIGTANGEEFKANLVGTIYKGKD